MSLLGTVGKGYLAMATGGLSLLPGLLSKGDDVNFDAPHIDPQTEKLINGAKAKSQQSEQFGIDSRMSGADQSGELNQAQADRGFRQASLGQTDGMGISDAINRRANKNYDRNFSNMRRQVELEAPGRKFKDSERAHSYAMSALDVEAANDAMMKRQRSNEEAARNQVIGNIFGAVGAGAGGYAGARTGGASSNGPNQVSNGAVSDNSGSGRNLSSSNLA